MAHHDVLLTESRRGIADEAGRALADAGHTVHRCHEPGQPAFPCSELAHPGSCPLAGHIDVALLVRSRLEPRPTQREDGAMCAIRAGVPLVEKGNGLLDPFDPWVINRVVGEDGLDEALDDAVERADGDLRRTLHLRTQPLLDKAGVPVGEVRFAIDRGPDVMIVEMWRPGAPDDRLDDALAVRMYDVVRSHARRRAPKTRVFIHHLTPG